MSVADKVKSIVSEELELGVKEITPDSILRMT